MKFAENLTECWLKTGGMENLIVQCSLVVFGSLAHETLMSGSEEKKQIDKQVTCRCIYRPVYTSIKSNRM